ncbi:FAD/NADP-binding domain-containing protein [Dacryopinax primogenitus]|uniref:FAD/NADP-binding domain-containing protein n=1 Tax=Dacryopinax primogenitus (strain DJM 731) TaxID=1858805 RepID=M5GCV1_DACPD|nr:FAD/NADP-binding domain-containing protein [Dacryopinax primogenitus]EJU01988.1 FAD/NADP-binding domain-containing protein [Dacryopinax primogenitus]
MKVLLIGGGITGPVLGMLLQHIGHEPVIFERQYEPSSGGIALQLTPQTMKVLRILGLDDKVIALGKPHRKMRYCSEVSGKVLFESDTAPGKISEALGWPMMCATERSAYTKLLVDETQKRGIPIYFNKRLVDVKQDGEKATAIFEDGTTESGDFLVGCDGLHSSVRDSVFGGVVPTYTGIVVVAGRAIIPPGFDASWATQIFGEGGHMFFVQTTDDHVCFGCTYPEPNDVKEDWRKATPEQVQEWLKGIPQTHWSGPPEEIFKHADRIVRFGMYQRPILPVWHKGRVVLCGDAAHPTAPYIGQGANQSLEDCYHMVRLLKKYEPLTTESLDKAFTEYGELRYPRVTKAVQQATQEGKYRIMTGRDACLERDAMLAKGMETQSWKVILDMLQGPYEKESQI